jgi:ribulose-phosphate 3-epimerase
MKLIAPSILSADFSRLGEEIRAVENAGADWIHVDVMDGHFVPNITMGPLVVQAARRSASIPIDVHLMIENADSFITDFVKAGASLISVQAEACTHLNRTLNLIKELGAKSGVALNPATPLSSVEWVLEYVDFILIMSVNPGFGGQAFIPNSIGRIKALSKMIKDKELDILIEVDGGVNKNTIRDISEAGADVFVAGSAVFGSGDYRETISAFKKILNS